MSTDLCIINKTGRNSDIDLKLLTFCGKNKTSLLQVTQDSGKFGMNEPGFIQLSITDAYKLIRELTKWIKQDSKEKAEKIQTQIDEHKELKKTILIDMVGCERFISDLEILEIPLLLLK